VDRVDLVYCDGKFCLYMTVDVGRHPGW
jgi:hypothetical protein